MNTAYLDLMTGPNREVAILAVTSDCFLRILGKSYTNFQRRDTISYQRIKATATTLGHYPNHIATVPGYAHLYQKISWQQPM